MRRIVISGMSGMIGSALAPFLERKGYIVQEYTGEIDHAYAVINLAGENIGNGRWTKKKKEKIYASRIETTKKLVDLMDEADSPPNVFISTSAVGYYGANAGTVDSESRESGTDFLAGVCRDWEKEAKRYKKGRVVTPRFGVVVTKSGGFLQKLIKLAKLRILTTFGKGDRKTSWIAMEDLQEAILLCLTHDDMEGAINFTTPHPFTNKECVSLIKESTHRRKKVPVPPFFIKLLFGQKGKEMLLADQSVHPKKLLESGFIFMFPHLEDVIKRS